MKKKSLTFILIIISILMFIFGLSACQDDGASDDSSTIIGGDINCEHLWSDWTEEQVATCQTTGLESRICTVCNGKEEKTIEKTAHKYNSENACEYCGVELAYTSGLEYEKIGYSPNYYYVVKGIGTATETDIVIPGQHAGHPVKSIASEAFYGNDRITSIFAPSTITEVGTNAFYYCEKLHTITLEGVNKIGSQAFKKCSKLEKISIKSAKEIGTESFSDCVKLKDVALSENTMLIGQNAFLNTGYYNASDNWESKALYIGKHLICVKEDYPNSSFTIKNGTLTIASYAFNNISNIEIVNFPNNEIRIGAYAFNGCSNWKEFEQTEIIDLAEYALGGTSLEKVVIGQCDIAKQLRIEDYNYHINVLVPNTVKSLTILNLHRVHHMEGDGSISFSSFTNLENLSHCFYDSELAVEAYKNLTKLKSITMSGIREGNISQYFSKTTFSGSVYVNGSYFPETLKTLNINGGRLGENALSNLTNFTSISIRNLAKSSNNSTTLNIYNKTLTNSTIENLTVDNSLENLTLGFNSRGNINIQNLYYEGSLADWLEKHHWTHCINNLYIDDKLVEKLEIPEGIETIPDKAFSYIKSIKEVEIPESVKEIGVSAFERTPFYDNEENWENGVLYCGKHLIESKKDDCGNTGIKEGTLVIADEAFKGSKNLSTDLVLPNSVTSIGDSAFAYCDALTSVTIPNSVTSIGDSAFYYCSSLKSVVIPNSVISIGEEAFYLCNSLTIYCEIESKPNDWQYHWNSSNCPVVWGYKGN